MALKKIEVSNFKSFKHLEIDVAKFSVLIGANASGKSNFVQIFRFLRDIANYGLTNAISMQGGIGYVRNMNLKRNNNLSIKIVADRKFLFLLTKGKTAKQYSWAETNEVVYSFEIKFDTKGTVFEITKDRLILKFDMYKSANKKGKKEKKEKFGEGDVTFSRKGQKLDYDPNIPKGVSILGTDAFLAFPKAKRLSPNSLLLDEFFPITVPGMSKLFSDISIYNFDPKLPKKPVSMTGRMELEEDGSNLAIVLHNIIGNEEQKRKLSNLMKDLLPFVDKLEIDELPDKSQLLKLREKYLRKLSLPACFLSDGTINVTALIVALYFEKKPLIIIEEPERNIHPYLISKIVNMMNEASKKKQIIVTTHNPEIVKYAGLKNILLISRDKKGFSNISRPGDKKDIKTFLKSEIGIEELYVQNLLGA